MTIPKLKKRCLASQIGVSLAFPRKVFLQQCGLTAAGFLGERYLTKRCPRCNCLKCWILRGVTYVHPNDPIELAHIFFSKWVAKNTNYVGQYWDINVYTLLYKP